MRRPSLPGGHGPRTRHLHRGRLAGIAAVAMAVATLSALGVSDSASATVPTITGPAAVFTVPDIPIAFSGTDPISHENKTITTTASSTGTCDATASPPVLDGCGSVSLSVGAGTLSYDPSGVDPTQGSPSGQGALQFAGTMSALNAALATLVYTPDLGYQNLHSTPTYLVVNSIDGVTGDDTSSGSPDQSKSIEIRVQAPNQFPTNTVPSSPQDVAASSSTPYPNNQFNMTDPDLDEGQTTDQALLIMWTSCGTFDLNGGSFVVGPDIKNLLNNQVGLDPTVTNAIYNFLPSSVKNLPTSTGETNVSAVIGVGQLADVQDALSTVTFHALATASTCTLHQLVDDLGNNGLPASYVNVTDPPGEYPTGVELPAMGFALSSVDFVVAGGDVPTVTINQGATQPDPTSSSPILFDVVFSEPVTGFGDAGVVLSGTAGATTAVVSGTGPGYAVSVTGMTQSGTVIATIPAGAATGTIDPDNPSAASTSTDNVVTYVVNSPPPTTTTTSTTTTTVPPSTTTTTTGSTTTTTASTTTTAPATTTTTAPASTTTTTAPASTTTTTAPASTTTTTAPASTTTTTAPASTTTTTAPASTTTTTAPASTTTTTAAASTTTTAPASTTTGSTATTTATTSTTVAASTSTTSATPTTQSSSGSGTTTSTTAEPVTPGQVEAAAGTSAALDPTATTGGLAFTGSATVPTVLSGVFLIEGGAVLVLFGRRRRSR